MKGVMSAEGSEAYLLLSELAFHMGWISGEQLLVRLEFLRHLLEDQNGDESNERSPEVTSIKDPSGDDIIQLYPTGIAGMTCWKFNPQDADHFPSVPHGHHQGMPHPKLDAYLGYIYDAHRKQSSRASRQQIIALWNDDKFRAMAKAAVIWYSLNNPHFKWRVKDPMRLPKMRKAKSTKKRRKKA